jgi:hypothetical protein
MWANFGSIVQVKHIDLHEDLAEDIVENTTADEVVIVCRDADAEMVERLLRQLGHKIRGIIRESELIEWYGVAFGKYRRELGEAILDQPQSELSRRVSLQRGVFQHFTRSVDMTHCPDPTRSAPSGSLTRSDGDRLAPSLQVEQLVSKLSQDETGKRQHYRPIYSLHKWWARRPGTLFRAIILLATQPDLRDRLLRLNPLGDLDVHAPYFASHDLSQWVILDPFMGGGTTLIEANRMGAKVIGCDINPVSYWIVRESLKEIDLARLDAYFEQLAQSAGRNDTRDVPHAVRLRVARTRRRYTPSGCALFRACAAGR